MKGYLYKLSHPTVKITDLALCVIKEFLIMNRKD